MASGEGHQVHNWAEEAVGVRKETDNGQAGDHLANCTICDADHLAFGPTPYSHSLAHSPREGVAAVAHTSFNVAHIIFTHSLTHKFIHTKFSL